MKYSEACEWLQLNPDDELDEAQLRRAFRAAAIREHPDKSTKDDATHRFQQVTHAHRLLLQCVARGLTGSDAHDVDDAVFEDENFAFDDGEEEADLFDDGIFFTVHVSPFGEMFIRVHFGREPEDERVPDPFPQRSPSYSRPSHPYTSSRPPTKSSSNAQSQQTKQQVEYLRKKQEEEDKEYEEYMARMYEYAKEREEERKKKVQREKERAEYMAERREQAASEGRQLFETWNIQQCLGEARRRGLGVKGLQHDALVELLIQDEAKKRTRRELKQHAPLIDEWAEVHDTKRSDINTKKVRVIDFYDGMYVVEWDASGGGKKVNNKVRHSKKARIKPEHLKLWGGAAAPPSPPTEVKSNDTSSAGADWMLGNHVKSELPKGSTTGIDWILGNETKTAPPSRQAPKMVKIKVKCPKDKKPGDVLEVKNPHAIGEKLKVRVPPKTVPGKSFTWLVRAAEASQEPVKIITCAVCSRDLKDDKTAVALRSCTHSVCKACLPQVQNKSCLQCGKPHPTIESLQHLPYLQELQAPENVLEKLLEEFFCCREEEAADGRDNAGKAKEALDHSSEKATKAVNRHYRQTSLKVHPDKHGEEFRAQFDILSKARDVMIDPKLRRLYIGEMVGIACKVDLSYIPRSHDVWIEKNDPEAVEQARRKKTEPGKQEQTLQLDGGVMYSRPRKARVSIIKNDEKLVEVFLPVLHEHQFLSYCKEAIIVGSCGDMDDDEIRLGHISGSHIRVVDGEIPVKLYLPKHSVWDICWYSRVDQGDGQLRDTPRSAEARLDLRSEKQYARMEKAQSFDELARRRTSEIRSYLGSHKRASSREEIESRYWALHREISRGRSTEIKLRDILKSMGESSSQALLSLHEVLEEASSEKAKLNEKCKGYLKKDARKNFKAKVALILEAGEAAQWIGSVSIDELSKMGGDANRLYQLLVEGKKANSLMLDGTTLIATSKRSDLFSSKQCELLKKRGDELENQSIVEANRVLEEAKKREKEEEKRREMEAMASLMPRGTMVKIHGLVTEKSLNDALATFMGIGQNKRYILRLYRDGREVALKESNFTKWDQSSYGFPTEFEGRSSAKVDPKPRSKGSHAAHVAREDVTETKGLDIPRTGKRVASPALHIKKSAGQGPKLREQEHCLSETKGLHVPYTGKPVASPALPVKKSAGQIHPKGPTKPREQQHGLSAAQVSPARKARTAHDHHIPRKKTPKRCNMRARCRFLRMGPNVCNYFHPPEEIALVHPPHQSPEATMPTAHTSDSFANPPPIDMTKFAEMEDKCAATIAEEMAKDYLLSSQGVSSESSLLSSVASTSPGIIGSGLGITDLASSLDKMSAAPSARVTPVSLSPTVPPADELLAFLSSQEACFKCLPQVFHSWLESEDISSLTDLAEAVSDYDYVDSEMVKNGLKKFKRGAFRKCVVDAVANI